MGALGQYFANIKNASVSIFEGMAVTLSWMFRRPMTIQYPDRIEKPVVEMLPERSRGILEADLGGCIACMLCERSCPLGVIKVEVGKTPDGTGRVIKKFDIDAFHCMHCGLCTEACQTGALRHTREFEACARDIRNLVLNYAVEPVTPWKLQKGVEPPLVPNGTVLRKVRKEWDSPFDPKPAGDVEKGKGEDGPV